MTTKFPDYRFRSRNALMKELLSTPTARNEEPLHLGQRKGLAREAEPRWTAADESRARLEIEQLKERR